MEKNIRNYGGTDVQPEYRTFNNARIVMLPCPYEKTASYKKGIAKGPQAILNASHNMELFDDELKKETYKIGIHTKPMLPLKKLKPEKMVRFVKKEVKKVLHAEKFPVIIGGEHSVSIGALEAVSESFDNLSVLHLDAHCDLRNEYEGSKFNHACVGRRFLESASLTEVGIRSLSKEENDFIDTKPHNLKIFDMYYILKSKAWQKEALESLKKNVYISIDLDVLDPSVMPSIGTPEPGGFRWYDVLDLLKKVSETKRIVSFDVVELSPVKDLIAPDFLASKLIYRLLGYIF